VDLGQRWERLVVAVYSRTPERTRRSVLRVTTPSYRVGVLVVLRRPDGRVLLVSQPYLDGWALPGGNLARGETPAVGAMRELREELGVDLHVDEPTTAQLRPHDRWVTFVVACDVDDATADRARSQSTEITSLGWFATDDLPSLHVDSAGPLDLLLGVSRG
jgi:8-oxo-dGTP diphosphatase